MFGIKYYKADSATYVVKTSNGKASKRGRGLSFFYNPAMSSIAALPVNAQESPFIFNLQTSDYQSVKVQGQVTYIIAKPEQTAELLNFNLKNDGASYSSEDPVKLGDRIIRSVQTLVQNRVQEVDLKSALLLNKELVTYVKTQVKGDEQIIALGIDILDVSIGAITPNPETSRALEAEAREEILKEADDAVYARRKSAVEQERTIKEAELQTEYSVQQKEQEIEEQRIQNERSILRGKAETEKEKIQAKVGEEEQKKELVSLAAENTRLNADSEAYAVEAKMKAFKVLPVEYVKAMAMSGMDPEQLMALAFESLSKNAEKIGELSITPDMFSQLERKIRRK